MPAPGPRTLEWFKANLASWVEEAACFGSFPSLYMGLVHETGNAAYSDGDLRVINSDGVVLMDKGDPRPYWEYIGEAVEPWSYLKSTFYKPLGYPEGLYRVGPSHASTSSTNWGHRPRTANWESTVLVLAATRTAPFTITGLALSR